MPRAAFSVELAAELGARIAEGRQTAPTRPHPNAPASPEALKLAGPAIAAVGMFRDASPAAANDRPPAAEKAARLAAIAVILVIAAVMAGGVLAARWWVRVVRNRRERRQWDDLVARH